MDKAIVDNMVLKSDAYKQTHWMQYPPGTENVYSYFESRGGLFPETMFFGLQYLLKRHLQGVVITQEMIEEADEECRKMFGQDYFNRKGWERILDEHGGRLPIEIRAVPEGMLVPNHNVLMTVVNTDPEVAFITNFVETMLVQTWYPATVATLSYNIKRLIAKYAAKTGEEVSPFHLNDFGFRGASSLESAGIGGMAHLVNFAGTDTVWGILYARKFYGAKDFVGGSVMASEHSTMTSWGKENEAKAYRAILKACPENATVSVVSDSYDVINAVENIHGGILKDYILSHDKKLVVRPDSGDPKEISRQVMDILWEKFGGTINQKGYKVLNPKVGEIYGDGINYNSIDGILHGIVDQGGFATSNIIFGMGGALLQQVHRDTQRFAFKASAVKVGGEWRDVFKAPKTDMAGKASKRGRLKLVRLADGTLATKRLEEGRLKDILVPVFRDGELLKEWTFDEVRARAAEGLKGSV